MQEHCDHAAPEKLDHYIHGVPPQDAPAAHELSAPHGYGRPLPVDLLVEYPELVYLAAAGCAAGCAIDVIHPVIVYLLPAAIAVGCAVDVMPPVLVYLLPAEIAAVFAVDVHAAAAAIAVGSAVDIMPPVLVHPPAAGNDAEIEY